MRLGCAALQRAVAENVFHLVEQQQCPALRQKTLRGAEGAQAVCAADGVAVLVFAGHLEQFAAHVVRQCAGQLGFARARLAMHEQVDPAPLRAPCVA